jgi:hypothetical protein
LIFLDNYRKEESWHRDIFPWSCRDRFWRSSSRIFILKSPDTNFLIEAMHLSR